MRLADVLWLTPNEAEVSVADDCGEDVACLHVLLDVEDDHKGRTYDLSVVDMLGDPDAERWLRSNEGAVLDAYDANLAKLRREMN